MYYKHISCIMKCEKKVLGMTINIVINAVRNTLVREILIYLHMSKNILNNMKSVK